MLLSACETWICRLLPALHAHLRCMTLLNSEECVLLEKKKKYGASILPQNHSCKPHGPVVTTAIYSGLRTWLCVIRNK